MPNENPSTMIKSMNLVRQMHNRRKSFEEISGKEFARSLKLEGDPKRDCHEDYFRQFNMHRLPNEEDINDFFAILHTDFERKGALMIALGYSNKKASEELGSTPRHIQNLKDSKPVKVFVALFECARMETDDEKITFLKQMENHNFNASRTSEVKNIAKLSMSPTKQLKLMSKAFKGDGDQKRKILREIIAFGMQTRVIEDAEIDAMTGQIVTPAVIALCDSKIALQSMQELNRMDHEYTQDESASSSIETQEERIRRLSGEAKAFREKQRETLQETQRQENKLAQTKRLLNSKN